MQPLQQDAVVFLPRKLAARIAHAPVGLPPVTVGLAAPRPRRHHQKLPPLRKIDPLDARKHRRLDLAQFLRHFLHRPV